MLDYQLTVDMNIPKRETVMAFRDVHSAVHAQSRFWLSTVSRFAAHCSTTVCMSSYTRCCDVTFVADHQHLS